MKKKPLILIGAGGHARSCIDVIENENKYYIYGIIDKEVKKILWDIKILDDSKLKIFSKK